MSPKIIPVIHYQDDVQALRNAGIAFDAGCEGVMLIQMEGENEPLLPIARFIKQRWPDRLVGVNMLGGDPVEAVALAIANGLDMTWTDHQPTHSEATYSACAHGLHLAAAAHPGHLVFVGVAFKHQRHEPDPTGAAMRAIGLGLVPTTSGEATGVAADAGRIADLRAGIGDGAPLAIASGITPGNVHRYAPHLSHVLVATGISSSFHEIDPALLAELMTAVAGGTSRRETADAR